MSARTRERPGKLENTTSLFKIDDLQEDKIMEEVRSGRMSVWNTRSIILLYRTGLMFNLLRRVVKCLASIFFLL